jgi:hypothetical protein
MKQHVNLFEEFDNDQEELKSMGFSNKPEGSAEERFDDAIAEWYQDPEVDRALALLRRKTTEVLEKWMDFADDEDSQELEQRRDWVYDNGVDDLGWFEFIAILDN